MILFAHTNSPRLEYISHFIANEIGDLKSPLRITNDLEEYRNYDGARINYSDSQVIAEELWIKPHTLLFEKDIHPQPLECFKVDGQVAFFRTEGDFPFDVLAAIFYLISRYEEYLPHEKDEYGRYAHTNSIAFREGFLQVPLVNTWLLKFADALRSKFPTLILPLPSFSFQPTYDIDEAFSYRRKSWWRTYGGMTRSIIKGEWNKVDERRRVLKGNTPDPYDAYDWMDSLHGRHKLKPIYFFLLASKLGEYDKNISPDDTEFRNLILQHSRKYEVGIHPSWQSGDNPSLIKKEIACLQEITGNQEIHSSRQHYIRMSLPQTYRHLINFGITRDYSMGYGTVNGFRASAASEFYWYDLEKEMETGLLICPFCYMDANSYYEQKFAAREALDEMRYYHQQVRMVNGKFITLCHNTFLGSDPRFEGWKEVYEQFISEVVAG